MSKKPGKTLTGMVAQYECTFRPEPEGGYTVRCAAFPELVTHGSTLEEARQNATRRTVIAVHAGDLPQGTLRDILKQAKISREQLLKLL